MRPLQLARLNQLSANSLPTTDSTSARIRCAVRLSASIKKISAGRGHAHLFTSYDVLCLDGMAINVWACIIVGTKRGTLE